MRMIKMIELEKNINNIMNEINQSWITAIKDAEKSGGGIDITVVFAKYSELVKKKDQAFLEAEQRIGEKRKEKKGFW